MKSKQVLDVQQMQHLVEMGLELKETMMRWQLANPQGRWVLVPSNMANRKVIGIPAYTLQDVLDALPKEIKYKDKSCWPCIELTDEFIGYYYENTYFAHQYVHREFIKIDESLIDVSYQLLCWAIEHGFIETNKNE